MTDAQPEHIPAVGVDAEIRLIPGPCGDVTGDGDVNVLDAVWDLQAIVKRVEPTSDQLILGDLDGDGSITIIDAVTSLQFITGIIPTLQGCGPQLP